MRLATNYGYRWERVGFKKPGSSVMTEVDSNSCHPAARIGPHDMTRHDTGDEVEMDGSGGLPYLWGSGCERRRERREFIFVDVSVQNLLSVTYYLRINHA